MRLNQWNHFSPFFSADFTQKYLLKKYKQLQIENSEQKSYQNCNTFIYYIEHAKFYYDQARIAPIAISPNLMFYGFTHLLKACILTIDPNYPESTSVLAHGVSTRKRKKQQYDFIYDEVKIQKNGFFSLISEKMFHMKHLEGEKFVMIDLLAIIPELLNLFHTFNIQSNMLTVHKEQNGYFLLPSKILDHFHMSNSTFSSYIESLNANYKVDTSLNLINYPEDNFLIKFDFINNTHHISTNKTTLFFPEVLAHYLILYNLSMISRYETEWWAETLKIMQTNDFPFILNFCNISIEKQLLLVKQFLKP